MLVGIVLPVDEGVRREGITAYADNNHRGLS